MPIIFDQLEEIFVRWNKQLNVKKPIRGHAAKWVYDNMKSKVDDRFMKEVVSLLKSIDMNSNVTIEEKLKTDNTYGKLTMEKNVVFNPYRTRL